MNLLLIGCIAFLCIYVYTYYDAISKKIDTIQELVVKIVDENERERASRTIDYYV